MKTELKDIGAIILAIFLCGQTYGQDTSSSNFFGQIKRYDLSTILSADSILTEDRENNKERIKRADILGFIGDNYQRFQIHFISIIQNPQDPYEYLAYGKTMVNEAIRSFQGTITIKQSKIYKSGDIPKYKQGFATSEVTLFEDKKESGTGFIKGKLTSNFIIDIKGTFRYDALMFVADGFSNNEFIGTWTSYKTNASKKCNWGDYRIPESGDLDVGVGEFSVNQKYMKNGWVGYELENMVPNPAIKKEKDKSRVKEWWE